MREKRSITDLDSCFNPCQSWLCVAGLVALGCAGSPAPRPGLNAEPARDTRAATEPAPASSEQVRQAIQAIEAKDFARAKELLGVARRSSPDDPQAAFYLGVAEQGLGNHDQARDLYREALRLDPRLVEASLNLSALLLDSGSPQDAAEALEVVQQALKTNPDSPELLMNQALALSVTGDYRGASQAYAKVLAKNPDDAKLRLEYARVLGKAGQKDQALGELARVAKSNDLALLVAAGSLHGSLGDYRGCVSVLDRVIRQEPAPEPYVRRGACKKELGDKAGARADYEQALKLDPEYAPAHLYLGWHLHFELKQDKQALAELEAARKFGAGTPIAAEADKTIAAIKAKK